MYQIKSIDLFVREISPPRMDFAIGKGKSLFPEWMRFNVEVRLVLRSQDGRSSFGCSADWPSFGWLDKRADVEPRKKLQELLHLIFVARDCYLDNFEFETVFDGWWNAKQQFDAHDEVRAAVPLCSSFALALIERALIDAACRIDDKPFAEMLKQGRLGIQTKRIHPELDGFDLASCLPDRPLNEIELRHTVGLNDPLTEHDLQPSERLNDGLPQTLTDYVEKNGIAHFKIKVCGNATADLERLEKIWNVIRSTDGVVTLDGNESFVDSTKLLDFVSRLQRMPGLYERIQFIEQPMNRADTHDENLKATIRDAAKRKPLVIDEADGYIHAFVDAVELGYQGVSHKNCKGVFKSLANFALCKSRNRKTESDRLFLSAEDLTSMPLVALQQDFAVIAALGLDNAERNGHHFFYGLQHLTESEKASAATHHPGLYRSSEGEMFLDVKDGKVDVSSLQVPGLGVMAEPDWESMKSLESKLNEFGT